MEPIIEVAKSGRAACRTCKEKIAKDELRLGEAAPNQFSEGEASYRWHHMKCAAEKKPSLLRQALETWTGDVPGRAELDAIMDQNKGKEKPSTYPYAEKAPTGRSKCLACEEQIEKGALRVAIEREVDAGGFMRKSAGYLHASCASGEIDVDDLPGTLKRNSVSLAPADLKLLEAELAKGGGKDEDEDEEGDEDEDEDEEGDEDEDEEGDEDE